MRRNVIGTATVLALLAAGIVSCRPGRTETPQAATEGWRRVDVSSVRSSADGTLDSQLTDVVAISPTDVWTVGFFSSPDDVPLAMHWDGTTWMAYQPLAPRQFRPEDPLD